MTLRRFARLEFERVDHHRQNTAAVEFALVDHHPGRRDIGQLVFFAAQGALPVSLQEQSGLSFHSGNDLQRALWRSCLPAFGIPRQRQQHTADRGIARIVGKECPARFGRSRLRSRMTSVSAGTSATLSSNFQWRPASSATKTLKLA
jgi:hypothetical protein